MLIDKIINERNCLDTVQCSDTQKQAYELYEEGLKLWNKDIGHDLHSEQAAKNVEAMKKWYASARMGYIQAAATIIAGVDEGGFVKDAETNKEVPFYGKGMGLNIDGKSGWEIIREFGQIAIDSGLDDPESFGNSPLAREIIYTSLAESYGDDECLGVEPWATDYEKSFEYYCKAGDLNFKTWRYVAEMYRFGNLTPPEGTTKGEITLKYMLKAVDSGDATANFYLGLWYLNDGGKDSELPLPEGETKYTMAVKYLEAGRTIANHGTIRKTMEALFRLADIYENGEGEPEVKKDLSKALEVYDEMLSEKYFPDNADVLASRERVLAEIEAEKTGAFLLLLDNALVDCAHQPFIKDEELLAPLEAMEVLKVNTSFDQAADEISVKNDEYVITMKPGRVDPVVNNTVFCIPVAAEIKDNTVFVPVRFMAEALGYDYCLDKNNRCGRISGADGHHPGEGRNVAGENLTLEFGGRKWRILEEKNDRTLIILNDIEETRPYNDKMTQSVWETCSMRKYLNGSFLESFSDEEQKQIIKTRIANPYNDHFKTLAGRPTEDKIFLISQEELEYFFAEPEKAKCAWWTRTPGIDQRFQVMVTPEGAKNNYGWRATNQLGGVRPAMWIVKEEPDPHCHPQMQLSKGNDNTLVISYDRPMNPQAASFMIEKDGVRQDITAVKWSEDHHTIYVSVREPLTVGQWQVFMENVRNNRKNRGELSILQ